MKSNVLLLSIYSEANPIESRFSPSYAKAYEDTMSTLKNFRMLQCPVTPINLDFKEAIFDERVAVGTSFTGSNKINLSLGQFNLELAGAILIQKTEKDELLVVHPFAVLRFKRVERVEAKPVRDENTKKLVRMIAESMISSDKHLAYELNLKDKSNTKLYLTPNLSEESTYLLTFPSGEVLSKGVQLETLEGDLFKCLGEDFVLVAYLEGYLNFLPIKGAVNGGAL